MGFCECGVRTVPLHGLFNDPKKSEAFPNLRCFGGEAVGMARRIIE
jgi:hypothetical protein